MPVENKMDNQLLRHGEYTKKFLLVKLRNGKEQEDGKKKLMTKGQIIIEKRLKNQTGLTFGDS